MNNVAVFRVSIECITCSLFMHCKRASESSVLNKYSSKKLRLEFVMCSLNPAENYKVDRNIVYIYNCLSINI